MESTTLSPAADSPQPQTTRQRVLVLIVLALALVGSLACTISLDQLVRIWNDPRHAIEILDSGDYPDCPDCPEMDVYEDIGASGSFTPTGSLMQQTFGIGPFSAAGIDVSTLEQRGFMAIRVPHVPPTYTTSSIVLMRINFLYHLPPTATIATSVPITFTHRNEYLPQVNAQFPITDGKSHWEVWWLPSGGTFPIPTQPFRLDVNDRPLQVFYFLDFGAGSRARACANCPLEYELYNGFVFIGHTRRMFVQDTGVTGNPLALFGQCGSNTLTLPMTPTVPFTHTHCLTNFDTLTRTFNLQFASSQNWPYIYYTQKTNPGAQPVLLAGNQVTVGPGTFGSGVMIHAVLTPTITLSDRMRETFIITATSTISASVQASAESYVLAPAYELNEGQRKLFLPLVVK